MVYVIDKQTDQRLEIAAGTYKIRPVGDRNSFDLSQDTLTMKRGGKVVVTVTKLADTDPDQVSRSATLTSEDNSTPATRSAQASTNLPSRT